MRKPKAYMLIILMFAVFVMSLGLMIAVPVWETQVQREKEEELIFRGEQYVEAIRIYTRKKPGAFPKSLEELEEEHCIRKLYKDPMTEHGRWNLILLYPALPARRRGPARPARRPRGSRQAAQRPRGGRPFQAVQRVMIAPPEALSSIDNPMIIGVVSPSTKTAIRIYNQQETYDRWLFYYGQDPKKMPEIVVYGQEKEK